MAKINVDEKFNIYANQFKMFIDVIKYNNDDYLYSEEYSIPISNKYYIMLLNNNVDETNNLINYLFNENRDIENPFDDLINTISFDKDQVYNMNLNNTHIKEIEQNINNIFNCVEESDAELALVIDIKYLMDLIDKFDKNNLEIHLYDFIIHKLLKKIDRLYIYDCDNLLKSPSIIYYELLELLKNSSTKKINDDNDKIKIYKNVNSIYWKKLESNQTFEYNYTNDKYIYGVIDGEISIMTSETKSLLYLSNIFNEFNDIVLHPLHKLKIDIE